MSKVLKIKVKIIKWVVISRLFKDSQLMLFCVGLNASLVYDDRYIKTKIRMYGNKVYTNFHDFYVQEDGVDCECFIITYISYVLMETNITDQYI